ncbi:UNVERIFIED_ORG: ribosomal protein S12 methylthiotransferase accessory factor [Rhodococcus erythropolis]
MVADTLGATLPVEFGIDCSRTLGLASSVPQGDILLLASDGFREVNSGMIRQHYSESRVRFMSISCENSQAIIGPIEDTSRSACGECLEFRRRHANKDSLMKEAAFNQYREQLIATPSPWLTPISIDSIVAAVAGRIVGESNNQTIEGRDQAVFIDLESLTTTAHQFLADPMCETCGSIVERPLMSLEGFSARPKTDSRSIRTKTMEELERYLSDLYVDEECGLIRELQREGRPSMVVAHSILSTRGQIAPAPLGFGRSHKHSTSLTIAILEGLERYCGSTPARHHDRVEDSYVNLGERALDPRTLGLPYLDPNAPADIPFHEFDDNKIYSWIRGFSFAHNSEILIPEACVYYDADTQDELTPYFYGDTSSGCAIGGSIEEAILCGILELAERDAFLMTWYRKIAPQLVDLSSATDPTIPLIARRMEWDSGYEISVFDITMEHGIPSVWVMAVNPESPDPALKLVCSAASHLDPESAVRSALIELYTSIDYLTASYPEDYLKAEEMVIDPTLVRMMSDHALLYGSESASYRFDFLMNDLETRAKCAISDVGAFVMSEFDITEDLEQTVERYLRKGLDVIVVDQTSSELDIGDLSAVRVFIPGLVPMSFGYSNRRIVGLPRLLDSQFGLGGPGSFVSVNELNMWPHPFP